MKSAVIYILFFLFFMPSSPVCLFSCFLLFTFLIDLALTFILFLLQILHQEIATGSALYQLYFAQAVGGSAAVLSLNKLLST